VEIVEKYGEESTSVDEVFDEVHAKRIAHRTRSARAFRPYAGIIDPNEHGFETGTRVGGGVILAGNDGRT
jgi:hypothetical protein